MRASRLIRDPRSLAVGGHLAAGGLLCVGSTLVWGYNVGGPIGVVVPWEVRGYETWSGRLTLLAGLVLLALPAYGLRTRRALRSLWPWLTAASGLAVAGVLAWTVEIPDPVPRVVTYRSGTGYSVSVVGAALALASSLLGLATGRRSSP